MLIRAAQRPRRAPRTRSLGAAGALLVTGLAAIAVASSGVSASAREARLAAAQEPTPGAVYKAGPSGRYLLGGAWLFRADRGVGLRDRYQDARSAQGWSRITVPNAWNAGDQSAAGYAASAGWYRKDFLLPSRSPADTWIVRFESINNSVTVWLNGHRIGTHTGAFLAFELVLPAADLVRDGPNRLVLRVSDAHTPTDLPPQHGSAATGIVGGWWNYGGVLREVYLRRVDAVDFSSVQVLPTLACATCAARISYSVVLHNYASVAERVALHTRYGTLDAGLGSQTIAPGASATFVGRVRVARPQTWSPSTPHLYAVTLDASGGARTSAQARPLAHYALESGIRAITVVGGQLELNYQPLHLRGVGLIEDSPTLGAALRPADALRLMTAAKALGATIVRSQYPLSAYEEQLADELGLMLWSEIPMYQAETSKIRAMTPAAVAMLRENILENGNHPSIVIWSIGNELAPQVSPVQAAYIADAVRAAHELDPTRPVGLAYQGYPAIGCQPGYAPLDVLGINDYFGWYAGPSGQIADLAELPDYLAQERACYPKQAIMVSEFGAEGDRDGPIDERGTYPFQSQFVSSQLDTFAATPWLSGAIWWTLSDFLVRPGWTGGNPYPSPPVFRKGLLNLDGSPKPAWAVAQRAFQATTQVG